MDSKSVLLSKNKYIVRAPAEYENEESELSESDGDPDYAPPQKKQLLSYSDSSD